MTIKLRVRETSNTPWIENFSKGGWKVRNDANTGWILMTPDNTKVRSMDNTTWLEVK